MIHKYLIQALETLVLLGFVVQTLRNQIENASKKIYKYMQCNLKYSISTIPSVYGKNTLKWVDEFSLVFLGKLIMSIIY